MRAGDESGEAPRLAVRADAWRSVLARPGTRLALSALILLSLLPEPVIEPWRLAFFAVFGLEILLRVGLLFAPSAEREDDRRRRVREVPFLVLDTVATLSFLPGALVGARYLRLVRLLRLVGYWRTFLGDLWTVSWRRERRHQFGFVVAVLIVGTLVGGAVLQVADGPRDFNDDGRVGAEDADFGTRLWWAFRQMQDPGNLVAEPDDPSIVVLSLALTIAGLFLLSFLIAVGTTVVDELLVLGRQRRLGLRGHAVVIADGPHAHFLLEELVRFQGKRVRRQALVVFGTSPERPDWLDAPALARVPYRHGNAADPGDLARADVDRAALVILLGDEVGGDAGTVSRVLAVRQLNPGCRIVADVVRGQNELSVREAGGPNTEPVLTRRFVGLLLAHELLFPGVEHLLRELLTHRGRELYLLEVPDAAPFRDAPTFAEVQARCRAAAGALALGTAEAGQPPRFELNPRRDSRVRPGDGLLLLARSEAEALDSLEGAAEQPAPTPSRPSPGSDLAERWALPEPFSQLGRVLACGHREELAETLLELAAYRPGLDAAVMVAPGAREAVASALEREGRGHITRRGAELSLGDGSEGAGRLRVLEGDPASDADLRRPPGGEHALDAVDAVLFVADGRWGADPDAKSALGLLKLFALQRAEGAAFRPGFRVVGEIQEPGKGDLLEHRFRRGASNETERFSVMPTEKLRHFLLGQAVFVPGVAHVYEELLSKRGQELVKLVPTRPLAPGPLDFEALLAELAPAGVLPIAVETLDEAGEVEVWVAPTVAEGGDRLPAGRLLGLFAVAETDPQGDVPRLTQSGDRESV